MADRHVTLLLPLASEGRTSMDRYGHELADAINRYADGFRATVLVPGERGAPPLLRGAGAAARYYARYVRYPRVARRVRSDLYHVVDHGYAHLVRALDPGRTVVTCHDLMLLRMADANVSRPLAARLAMPAFRYSVGHLRRAAAVVCVSRATAADVRTYVGVDPQRMEVVYSGLNDAFVPLDESARLETRRRWRLPGGKIVLHVGDTSFYKNVEGVLATLRILVRSRGVDCRLVKVGKPFMAEQRSKARAWGIADRVLHLGEVPEPELPSLYNAADVLLFPSLWEGFGWPPLEAMACGVPVVTTGRGGLAEAVGEAAVREAPDDHEGLARAVEAVLTDQTLRARLVRRGREQAAQFRWDDTGREMARIYEATLRRAERSRPVSGRPTALC